MHIREKYSVSGKLSGRREQMGRRWNMISFPVVLGFCELVILILFGIFVDYGWDGTPVSLRGQFLRDSRGDPNYQGPGASAAELSQPRIPISDSYPMFQDVHVMIFIGFGFLMTFMRRYGYGGVGFNFILASLVTQWSILMRGFFEMPENHYRIRLDMNKLISAEFSAGTILISLGVVLGKLSPVQYVMMVVLETALAMVNEYIVLYLYGAVDVGGTITIHLFGAYFGLALARTIHRKEWSTEMFNELKYGTHYNDLFSMIGTVFLFMFWPSFNAAQAVGDSRYRAIFNTYFAISSSVIGAFIVCWIVKKGKFTMDIVQNGTLSGGVIVGSVCSLYLYPWGAIVCGLMAGIISSLGFHFMTPFLDRKWGIHDTCGVHNLHALPALFGTFISAIVVACATPEVYGSSYYLLFPNFAPSNTSQDYFALKQIYPDLLPGSGRTPTGQAANQLASLITTVGISLIGGVLTGLLLRIPIWDGLNISNVFDDESYWVVPNKLSKDQEGTLRSQISSDAGKSSKRRYPIPQLEPPTDYVVNMIAQQNARIQASLANRHYESSTTEFTHNGVQL